MTIESVRLEAIGNVKLILTVCMTSSSACRMVHLGGCLFV